MDLEQWKYACECLQVVCKQCEIYATDQLGIHFDLAVHENVVATDSITQEQWVICDACQKFFHLKCATNLSQSVIEHIRFICSAEKCVESLVRFMYLYHCSTVHCFVHWVRMGPHHPCLCR